MATNIAEPRHWLGNHAPKQPIYQRPCAGPIGLRHLFSAAGVRLRLATNTAAARRQGNCPSGLREVTRHW